MPDISGKQNMVIVRFQKTFPIRVSEWALATILFNFGMVVLLNPGILEEKVNFAGLIVMMSERGWGVSCTALALIRLGALAVNGAWRPTPHIRAVAAFATMVVWMLISFALANSRFPSIGLSTYPIFLLLDMYNVYRAASDARIADQNARLGKPAHV